MKSSLPKKNSRVRLAVLPLTLFLVLASGFLLSKNTLAFSPFDFLKSLPIFGGGQKTPEAPAQTQPLFPIDATQPNATPEAVPVDTTNPPVTEKPPVSQKMTVVAANIVSPIPSLEELFKVSADKILTRRKITTIGKIVTPVAVADLAMDSKKIQGKTLFDAKGQAVLPDGAKIKGRVEFGKDLNFYIDENGNASLYNITAENDLDVLGHIHNSKNKVVEITDPLNLSGGKLYNSLGSVIIDDNLDVTGNLGFSGPVTLNPASPSNQAYKFYSGNIGSPIAGNRLIFTDTSGGDARYWFDSSSNSSGLSIASTGNEQLFLGYQPSVDTRLFVYQNQPFSIYTGNATQTPRLTVAANGNVGIGTTAPTQKLDVNGNVNVAGNYLYLNNNTSSYVYGDASNGIMVLGLNSSTGELQIKNSANVIKNVISVNGVSYFNGGYVGIGTTNPAVMLTVTGEIEMSSNGNFLRGRLTNNGLSFIAGIDSSNYLQLGENSPGASYAGIKLYSGLSLTPTVTMNNSGNVGIGTTNPTQKLDVAGNINVSTGSTYKINGTDVLSATTLGSGVLNSSLTRVGVLSSGSIAGGFGSIITANTIATTGNVGIGVTSPLNRLDVSGSAAFGTLPGAPLPANTTAYFSGNVGIGTTGPIAMLTVSKSAITTVEEGNPGDSTVLIRQNTNNLGASALEFGYGATGTFATARLVGNVIAGGGGEFRIQTTSASTGPYSTRIYVGSTGNVGIGSTAASQALDVTGTIHASNLSGAGTTLSTDGNGNIIRTPSDLKLKENITPITGALSKVLALNGVYYDWKDKGRFGFQQEIGFIAQDVQKVVPEVVRGGGDYLSLNYGNLTAILAEAVREVNGKVDENGVILSSEQTNQSSLERRISEAEKQIDTVNHSIGLNSLDSSGRAPQNDGVLGRLSALEQNNASISAELATQTGQSVGLVESLASRVSFLESLLFGQAASREASTSAKVSSQLSSVNGQVSIDSNLVAYSNLNVLGKTAVGDLYATGRISAGLLTIDGLCGVSKGDSFDTKESPSQSCDGAAIYTISSDLYLQNNPLAGNVNIFNGKIMMLANGDIVTTGLVTADKVKANELTVSKVLVAATSFPVIPDPRHPELFGAKDLGSRDASGTLDLSMTTGQNDASGSAKIASVKDPTIGSVIIPAGQTSIPVANNSITNNSLIFATPDAPVAVGTKKDTNSFTINIKEAVSSDLKVNWWIIN